MTTYWILFIVMATPGANGGLVIERVNYPTEAACTEASESADKSMEPWLGSGGTFCLKATG